MECYFIRHGETKGNLEKRYIGVTDESLCEAGIGTIRQKVAEGYYPAVELVIHTGMRRTKETAELIYGQAGIPIVEEMLLRECDFGTFEGKNYQELSGSPDYQAWIDSNGTLPFPQGESMEIFKKRCIQGFMACMQQYSQYERIAFCVHGGTIMAILSTFAADAACNMPNNVGKEYYDYQCMNGSCISCEVLPNCKKGFLLCKNIKK